VQTEETCTRDHIHEPSKTYPQLGRPFVERSPVSGGNDGHPLLVPLRPCFRRSVRLAQELGQSIPLLFAISDWELAFALLNIGGKVSGNL
jgi:hypothetical protein